MAVKIKYLKEDDIYKLKANLDVVYKNIIGKRSDISEIFNDIVVHESKSEIDPLDFVVPLVDATAKDKTKTDIENVKIVYNSMMGLSDSEASDERIWTAIALTDGLDYMVGRWNPKNANDLRNRFFFFDGVKMSLYRNGIARLWWIGRMTYDSQLENPYELTEFLCTHQDFIESFFGRNIFSNRKILRSTLLALKQAEGDGIPITGILVRDLSKYLIVEGAFKVLDFYTEEEIFNKVINYVKGKEDNCEAGKNSLAIYFELADVNIGCAVCNKEGREGVITSINNNYVKVKFSYAENTYTYPDAFVQGFLKVVPKDK